MPELTVSRWLFEPAAGLKACRLVERPEPVFQYSTIPTLQLGATELNSMVAWQEKTE